MLCITGAWYSPYSTKISLGEPWALRYPQDLNGIDWWVTDWQVEHLDPEAQQRLGKKSDTDRLSVGTVQAGIKVLEGSVGVVAEGRGTEKTIILIHRMYTVFFGGLNRVRNPEAYWTQDVLLSSGRED